MNFIDGVTMLNSITVNKIYNNGGLLLIFALCITIAIITISFTIVNFVTDEIRNAFICLAITAVLTVPIFFIGKGITTTRNTFDYTKYQVICDDTVSFNEFMENYEILDIDGKIYSIKIKENENK